MLSTQPTSNASVIVIEEGEYEQHGVVGVAATREDAIEFVKARHASPYRVEWRIEVYEGVITGLHGGFEQVPGYSTEHETTFEFFEYDVYRTALNKQAITENATPKAG